MKLRFLAAAGPAFALKALSQKLVGPTGTGLVQTFESEGLIVWTMPGTPFIPATDGGGLLVGRLFDRTTGASLSTLPRAADARQIIKQNWGPYVLFTRDANSHAVLRDPSGALPVYHGSLGQTHFYASDAHLLRAVWPEPLRPDMEFIRHWLTYPFLRAARTGALGIQELVPGTCRRVGPAGGTIVTEWSPLALCGHELAITDFDEAAATLRTEIVRTISALAAAEPNVVLQLSGGLDSSIIGAALHQAGVPFRAITFATRAPGGDERRFARFAAERYRVDLVEMIEEDCRLDLKISPGHVLRPPPNPLLLPLHRALALQLTHMDASIALDGAGGDNIFCALNTASPAVDAFHRAGSAAAFGALRDIAQLHRSTLWAAAASAMRRARRSTPLRWPRDTRFLAADAGARMPEPHPWLTPRPSLPPGTADHIRTVAGIFHFLADPQPLAPACLRPLLAQPVMELCLRIPSWLWVSGGRDRSVARAAFRGLAPDAILKRRSKGTLESMFVRGYMAHRSQLEHLLVGGRLADHGIIDEGAIGAYLRSAREPRDIDYIRILEIAAAEQWLRSFSN